MPPLPVPEAQQGQGIARSRAAHGQQGQIQGAGALVQTGALEADQQRGQTAAVAHGPDQGQGLLFLQPPQPRARGTAAGRGVLFLVLKGKQQNTHQ